MRSIVFSAFLALTFAVAAPVSAQLAPGEASDSDTRLFARRDDPNGQFTLVLESLGERANSRPTARVRVMVELAIDPADDVEVTERTRNPRSEQRYRAAVARGQDALANELGARYSGGEAGYINRVDGLPFVSVLLDAREIETLGRLPYVASIAEEGEGQEFLQGTVPQVDADLVHAGGNTGTYKTVAVIDSGVQTDHPFFSSRLLAGACYSTSEPGLASICAGGVTSGSTTIASGGPCTFSVAGEGSASNCRHGTHVAGIAAGNASSLSGVAPSANLISIQASSLTNSCGLAAMPCRRYLESDIANALNRIYALRNTHPIVAVNLSLGLTGEAFSNADCTDSFPALAASVAQLDSANIAVVAASGNFASAASPQFNDMLPAPACVEDTISVAAVTKADAFAAYSNANQSLLDLVAPGGHSNGSGLVESSVVGSSYDLTFGTSQSAPHVSGAIALLRDVYPYASPRALERQFKDTGPNITLNYSYPGGTRNYTKRRLDVDDALIGPSSPSATMTAVTVTRENCYGHNNVSWSAVSGADEYHVEGSASSSFSSPALFGLTRLTTTNTDIDVPATRYIRARACNGVSCGSWQTANITATYYNGCL